MVTRGGGLTMGSTQQASGMERANSAPSRDAPNSEVPAFEDILARLNTVVEKLETGDLPLEASLALFEEGVQLSRLGESRLNEAEHRVERLLSDQGGTVSTAPRNKENEAP
jgi:exodeoxyribonuclease VII small subunit